MKKQGGQDSREQGCGAISPRSRSSFHWSIIFIFLARPIRGEPLPPLLSPRLIYLYGTCAKKNFFLISLCIKPFYGSSFQTPILLPRQIIPPPTDRGRPFKNLSVICVKITTKYIYMYLPVAICFLNRAILSYRREGFAKFRLKCVDYNVHK